MMNELFLILEITLSASLTAALLLLVKWLFHDKLSARWHYLIWCVLLVRFLVPVEQRLFRTPLSLFQTVPLPQFFHACRSVLERNEKAAVWGGKLWQIYLVGVLILTLYYTGAYLYLRYRIRKSVPADERLEKEIQHIAGKYQISACNQVRLADFTPSPFAAGIFRPVLVLPVSWAFAPADEKERREREEMVLHELLHMKYMDVAVNFLLHIIRILNWFNPFLWYVLGQIQNDNEALCDQRVLERLEKGRKKEYGRLLLSMADQKTPPSVGTTSMANGGANIRKRMVRIADFERVPACHAFASLAITLILSMACVGYSSPAHTFKVQAGDQYLSFRARLYEVSTPQDALDIYMKGLANGHDAYMALVLPEEVRERGDDYFSKLQAQGNYAMRILSFTRTGEERYEAKLGFLQESYGEEGPSDWQLSLDIYRDFDWMIRPGKLVPLETHFLNGPDGLEHVFEGNVRGTDFEVTFSGSNEVGFDRFLFANFDRRDPGEAASLSGMEDTFQTDFSTKTRWLQMELRYTGAENLTGRTVGVYYGEQGTVDEEEADVLFKNIRMGNDGQSGMSGDQGGWQIIKVSEDWDGTLTDSQGRGPELWSPGEEKTYVVRIYVDGVYKEELICPMTEAM